MKKSILNDGQISRRSFLKRAGLGVVSLMGIAAMGTTLFSSCEKSNDEDDLAEFEEENKKREEEKNKNNNA